MLPTQVDETQTPHEDKIDLDEIARESHEELARFKAVWPFDLFPDEIIINKSNVTIIRHFFFFVEEKIICHFDDLINTHLNIGPFFGSIGILSKYFTDGREDVQWFSRRDAERLHAILQGLLIARKEGVSLRQLPKETIIEKLYAIGKR